MRYKLALLLGLVLAIGLPRSTVHAFDGDCWQDVEFPCCNGFSQTVWCAGRLCPWDWQAFETYIMSQPGFETGVHNDLLIPVANKKACKYREGICEDGIFCGYGPLIVVPCPSPEIRAVGQLCS